MFVVGAALFYTGLAQKIGETVVSRAGTNENSLMLAIMVITAIMSEMCIRDRVNPLVSLLTNQK